MTELLRDDSYYDDDDEGDYDDDDEGDYDDDDEEDYDDNDYEDDSSFVNLPVELERELDRREKTNPPITAKLSLSKSEKIVRQVRSYFLHDGGKPYFYGGYIDLLEQLGVTPSSRDELVKDVEYNRWRLTFNKTDGTDDSHDDELDEENWRSSEVERHRSLVRLLRYGEFIEYQEKNGLGYPQELPADESAAEDNFNDPFEAHAASEENDDDKHANPNMSKSKMDDDDFLTLEQVISMGTCGFYGYVNHNKVYVGLGAGQTSISEVAGCEMRTMQFDMCQDTLLNQFHELHGRYWDLKTPLGPDTQFSENKKPTNTLGTHAQEITAHTHNLLETLFKILKPSGATAHLVSAVAQMLLAAVMADIDVARALIQTQTVLQLRQKALAYAEQADANVRRRAHWVGSAWWVAYHQITELIGDSIRFQVEMGDYGQYKITAFRPFKGAELVPPDVVKTTKYYTEHVERALFKSIRSPNAVERYSALKQLAPTICALPFEIAMRFVKDKVKWQTVQDACSVDAFQEDGAATRRKLNYRQQKRHDSFAKFAAREAICFFWNLGKHGMTIDNGVETITTQVIPGKLTHRIIQKGIVPLLMEVADSSDCVLSLAAVSGLAQLSRAKDCRLLMWQHPNSVEFIHRLLKSSKLHLMSETMLLVTHLLWDAEWAERLLDLDDDQPLERVAVRWAAYCMRLIRDKAYRLRKEGDEDKKETMKQVLQKYKLKEGTIERASLDFQIEENRKKQKNMDHWLDLETNRFRSSTLPSALCRCVLVLSTMHQRDPEYLLRVNVLHLVSCCIDIPTEDHHGGAATLLTNILAWRGTGITPDLFPDPEHLVHSLLNRLELQAQRNKMDRTTKIFMQLTIRLANAQKWKPHFDLVAKNDEVCKFWINELLPQLCRSYPGDEGRAMHREVMERECHRASVHNSCRSLTGKLKQCERCGRLEGKAKEFPSCSRCNVVVYCGRECQKNHWKKHKKECVVKAAR